MTEQEMINRMKEWCRIIKMTREDLHEFIKDMEEAMKEIKLKNPELHERLKKSIKMNEDDRAIRYFPEWIDKDS